MATALDPAVIVRVVENRVVPPGAVLLGSVDITPAGRGTPSNHAVYVVGNEVIRVTTYVP